MVCKPNARMCGQDYESVLRCQQMVRILFAMNRNVSVFLREHKENWMCRVSLFCSYLFKESFIKELFVVEINSDCITLNGTDVLDPIEHFDLNISVQLLRYYDIFSTRKEVLAY